MVLATIVNGVYKPTYNWGAPHCRIEIAEHAFASHPCHALRTSRLSAGKNSVPLAGPAEQSVLEDALCVAGNPQKATDPVVELVHRIFQLLQLLLKFLLVKGFRRFGSEAFVDSKPGSFCLSGPGCRRLRRSGLGCNIVSSFEEKLLALHFSAGQCFIQEGHQRFQFC